MTMTTTPPVRTVEEVREPGELSDRDIVARAARQAAGRVLETTTRVSVALGPGGNVLTGIHDKYAPLAYNLPWETLEYVELLATYNPDMSQAIENTRTLANSGHELFVEGGGVRASRRIKGDLENVARLIQESHGGIDGVIDKLLKQAATFGAMCGEWIIDEELTTILDFVDTNPKSIRFFWEDNHWAPYQKVTAAQAKEAERSGQKIRNGNCVKLNELTFRYYAFDAAPNSPYGVPPFVSALRNIAIQLDMVDNLAQIVRKVGLLGMVDMTLKELPRQAGETPEAYENRAIKYLEDWAYAVQEMVQTGGLVHYEDVEIETQQITGNAAGATNIFKQNEELIFSGLNSMPSVQGRSYSTTETYAGVAYDIIIRNTLRHQRAARRMIEAGYWLQCALRAEAPKDITLKFNSNKTLHRLQEAQAEAIEIRNAALLWLAGLLDHTSFAQRLGFAEPKKPMDEPPPELISGKSQVPSDEENAGAVPGDSSGS